MSVYIITVIYNRCIDEIRSLRQFERLTDRYPGVRLIVTDNSTDREILRKNAETAAGSEWMRYIACNGNIGLSRAYNLALTAIPQEEPFWVMLSDDDTFFSMEYLDNAFRQIQREERKQHPLRMLCGVVQTESGWISPRSMHTKECVLSFLLKRPKPGIYRDLYPINSGLFLAGSAIREAGGFDERLFLDQVDFLMMDRLREKGIRRIGVLPGEIRQAFSGEVHAGNAVHRILGKNSRKQDINHSQNSKGKTQTEMERWEIFRTDFETYCSLTNKPWYYREYILGRRRLMLMSTIAKARR